ncbi:hypothetical protein G7Y89_g4741 [Cudoniella acicularis]|uniref:Uncharacterized protein n=1 Tax=Cudoniella acicularis TaxID=354080 RepID=A0A8H4RNU3_9HELO|nr:hypothetical protein G7Y89_g4741 [Cudoniella acicularis]
MQELARTHATLKNDHQETLSSHSATAHASEIATLDTQQFPVAKTAFSHRNLTLHHRNLVSINVPLHPLSRPDIHHATSCPSYKRARPLTTFVPNNINGSTGTYLEDDLDNRVAKLETGIQEFKTDVKEWKTDAKEWKAEAKDHEKDINTLKTRVKEFDMERKAFQHDIFQKFDTFRTELTSSFTQSQKDLAASVTQSLKANESATEKQLAAYLLEQQKQLAAHSLDQQKLFSNLYFRGLFTILGVTALLVGGSVIIPLTESQRLDSEIKKRAIVKRGADELEI